MAKNRVSSGLPTSATVFMDVLGFALSIGPGLLAWLALLAFLRARWESSYFYYWALLSPLVLMLSFVLVLFTFRLFVPRLEKGVYPMGLNKGVLAWACHLGLSRAAEVAGLRPLLNAFFWSKFLHWRALGMKIAYGTNTSIGVSFVDLSMITIGKGTTISEGVHIACHTFVGDRLFIAPVEIGENAFIGMNCLIGPRTKIGAGAWVGMSNLIAESVPAGAKIADFAWEHGKEKAPAPG